MGFSLQRTIQLDHRKQKKNTCLSSEIIWKVENSVSASLIDVLSCDFGVGAGGDDDDDSCRLRA